MAARVPDLGSDFAQKMLQDLRRRRERLGFGSPSSASAHQQQQRAASSTAAATASRDACSNSQTPSTSQRPQQAAPAPRSSRPEATTTPRSSVTQQQPSTSNAVVASAAKPRRARPVAPADADARAIVPFQGGGGGAGDRKPEHAVDVQMAALALALSEGAKLRNIEVVARNGSVFFRKPDAARRGVGGGGYLLPPPPPSGGGTGAHAGEVAIGVQDLNDMLMAAYSSGGRRRPDDEARKKLFRGSMDMEEALSMLVMLQDASRYMEGSGSGLKGKENRKGSPATRSARIEEIVDEDSDDAEHAKHASMQMVVHDKFQSHQTDQSPDSSSVMQSDSIGSKINSASEGEKDVSKVRMPSVIAKLMGLENLPSSTTTTAAERKGTERFVKPGAAVPRMETRGSPMDRKLPIRIIASEKGRHKIVLAEEWKNGLTNFGESEMGAAAALSNGSSHPATGNSKQGRLTMREVLRKMVAAERGADESQEVNKRIIHEDKTAAEEIKLQNSVSVGCRADSGKRMDFLRRFRKNSDNRPAKEEKQTAQVKNAAAGKKQATGMRRLLGRDGEAKSRRGREKVNKENLAAAETKAAAKDAMADQMRKQAQSKHVERQITTRKPQNRRETQSETHSRKTGNKKPVMSEAGHIRKKPEHTPVTQQENEEHVSVSKPADSTYRQGGLSEPLAIVVRGSSMAGSASLDQPLQKVTEGSSEKATETPREPQNRRETQRETPSRKLENKKLPLSEAGDMRKKLEYTVVAQQENEVDAKVNDTISSSKPADSTHGGGGLSEPSTMVVRDSTTAEAASLDQPLQKITEGTSDPTIPAESVVVQASEDLKFLDQIAIAEINDERINHTPSETTQIPEIFAEEEQQQQQQDKEQQQMIVKEQLTEDLKLLDQSTIPETNDDWINHTPSEATQMPEPFAEKEQQQQQQEQEQEQQTIVIPESFTEEEEQQQQMIAKEQLTDGSDHTTTSISSENLRQDHKTHVITCDSLTENQLLLMRLLVKDRYLLETAKSIVRVDAPVSFIDDDVAGAPNWSDKGNDLLSDVAREVTRRKGKRSEAMEEVSVARAANPRLRYIDDLVRELDGDVESLDMSRSKRARQQGDNGAAENLRRILEGDIQNEHPDANSTWDFGWNRVWGLPLEKGDVVRDLEKNILGGIITDVARDLIGASVRHGCCPCVA